MLVEHQHVEAHLLGVDLLVEIAVVQIGPEHRVVAAVAHHEIRHVDPALHQVRILIGPLGEVADLHACAPLCSATCASTSSASRSGSSRSTKCPASGNYLQPAPQASPDTGGRRRAGPDDPAPPTRSAWAPARPPANGAVGRCTSRASSTPEPSSPCRNPTTHRRPAASQSPRTAPGSSPHPESPSTHTRRIRSASGQAPPPPGHASPSPRPRPAVGTATGPSSPSPPPQTRRNPSPTTVTPPTIQPIEQLQHQNPQVPRLTSPIRAVRLPISRQVRHDHRKGSRQPLIERQPTQIAQRIMQHQQRRPLPLPQDPQPQTPPPILRLRHRSRNLPIQQRHHHRRPPPAGAGSQAHADLVNLFRK